MQSHPLPASPDPGFPAFPMPNTPLTRVLLVIAVFLSEMPHMHELWQTRRSCLKGFDCMRTVAGRVVMANDVAISDKFVNNKIRQN